MEWVGFLAVVGLACYLLVAAYCISMMTLGFGGKWSPWALVPIVASGLLFWFAYTHAPFAIVAR